LRGTLKNFSLRAKEGKNEKVRNNLGLGAKMGQFSGTLNNFFGKIGTLTIDSVKSGTVKILTAPKSRICGLSRQVPLLPALSHF